MEPSPQHPVRPLAPSLKVAIAYATFAALWILLSDKAVALVFRDPGSITLASTLKGWFFVVVTSLLLFGLVNRLTRGPQPLAEGGVPVGPAWWWRGLVYLFAVAITFGALAIRLAIPDTFAERPFLNLFLFPIILSAFIGGLGPGLTATLMVALLTDYFLIPPLHALGIPHPMDRLQWGFLLFNGLLVSILSEVFHRSRYQVEANRRLQVVTLESIGDAVITTDTEGLVTFLNPVAERLTGWACREAVGRSLASIFPVINEESREAVQDPVQRVLASGEMVGLANHTLLLSRDGREIPIHDSAAPIRLPSGKVFGVVLVFRDDTERRTLAKAQEERLNALGLLDAIAGSSSDAIFAKDREGRYLLFNREAGRITGKGPEEVLGKDDTTLFPPAEAGLLMELGRRVMAENQALTSEEELTTVQGKRVFLATKEPLRDAEGRVVGIFGISRDITERKQAEGLMRERLALQEQLSGIALSVPGAICSFRLHPDGHACMPFSTPAVEELYGLPQAELAEDMASWASRVHAEDLPRVDEGIRRSAEAMCLWHDEYRYQHPGKGPRWIEGWSIPKQEPDGSVIWHGFVTDVTERKVAEDALRESEASLERAQAIAQVGSWRLEIGTGALSWSREAYRVLGLSAGEPLDLERVFGLVHPDDRAAVVEAWREALAGGAMDLEHRILADGGPRWVREQAEVRKDAGGRPILGFGTIQDITERKQGELERVRLQAEFLQAQKMESIGRLAGGVAHDFNNMLQVISGNAELALNRLAPEDPLHGEIQLIRRAADRSSDLTRQLLAFARRQAITPKVMNLNDAVASMLKMLGRLVSEDIQLVWAPGTGLWRVRIDPAQLDQVLANLTVNARDAIAGVGTITLATDNEVLGARDCLGVLGALPGEYVTLEIRDTGCGMTPEVLEHIFEPFFTTKSSGQGTGLGLATVFGIARQNGGFVRVSSEPGSGSTFRVSLPRVADEDTGSDPGQAATLPRSGGETILLVEDDEALLLVGEAMLKELGYAVIPEGSPEQAIRRLEQTGERIHLFLVDVVMPGMNGRELAGRLAALRPEVPVLFMSGYTADVIADRGTVGEELNLIAKPFSLQDLAVKIREVLGLVS